MRDRVWARLAAVIAAVLALLAVPPEAIAVEPTVSLPAHAYDGQHRPAIVASDAVERGPPARTSTASTSVAADGWSSDASARSERAGTPTAYTYNDFAESVQVVKAPATTSEVTPDIQRTPAPTTRWQAAANSAAPRFIGNSAGDILDTTRVTIPEGKFGYLLKNPSKSGVFKDSMGFDQAGLDSALRSHLTTNFGNASASVPMTGGGTKFVVRGPLTGPSGQTWNITSAWGVDVDGTIRLITATP